MNKIKERAKKGTISIRKKSGGYEARITIIIDDNTLRLSKYSSISEKEARKKLEEAIIDAHIEARRKNNISKMSIIEECNEKLVSMREYTGTEFQKEIVDKVNTTTKFVNIAKGWIMEKQKDVGKRIASKTLESYVRPIKTYLVPVFGQMDVSNITRKMFQDYIDSKNIGRKCARDCFLVMKFCMDYAKKQNYITINPIKDIELPKESRKEIKHLSEKEQIEWLNIMEQDAREWVLLLATLLQTGMRPEEGCGLKWKSIDFYNEIIKVENSFVEELEYDENLIVINRIRKDSELKTIDSYRTIPIRPRLKRLLEKLKEKRMTELKEIKGKWSESDYVFLNEKREPYISDNLSRKMPSFRRKYNLDDNITAYGLRHSFATLCSEKGVSDVVLKKLMGHSDPATTKKYYIHVSDERKKQELDKLDI